MTEDILMILSATNVSSCGMMSMGQIMIILMMSNSMPNTTAPHCHCVWLWSVQITHIFIVLFYSRGRLKPNQYFNPYRLLCADLYLFNLYLLQSVLMMIILQTPSIRIIKKDIYQINPITEYTESPLQQDEIILCEKVEV